MRSRLPARTGQPYDSTTDHQIAGLFNAGFTLAEVASTMERPEISIRIRLERLGLLGKDGKATLKAAFPAIRAR